MVLSVDRRYQDEIAAAVEFEYQVRLFEDHREALTSIRSETPDLILVDEDPNSSTDLRFINSCRLNARLSSVPIILTTGRAEKRKQISAFANVTILDKPYKKSALFKTMTEQVSRNVEASWEKIEPVQRAALKDTLQAFNSVADAAANGGPISHTAVTAKCEFLNTAIRDNTVKDLLNGVRDHDNYSYVHSVRIATFLGLLGNFLGIKGDDLSILTCGGLSHDIGKLTIPHGVLNKPGRLTGAEFDVMKGHVTATEQILYQDSDLPKGIGIIACQHHEKLDGSGYPYGLKGRELNELARMAAIVDVFGALTDRRIYKPPMPPEDALELMKKMQGHLDQNMLTLFREMLLDSLETATTGNNSQAFM